MARHLSLVLVLVMAVLLGPGFTRAQDDPTQADTKTVNVELILDASGSMAEILPSGETRMAVAKRILRDVIAGLPERQGVNVGLRVYGHLGDNTQSGKAVSCRSSELLVPVAGLDKTALTAQVEAIQPTGWTPIAYSLEQAAADFQPGGESITNAVVLVTDGEETCDPPQQSCDAAGTLHQSDVSVTTHVVGFALTPEQTDLVRCVAEQGGGQLFGADNAEELSTALGSALEGVGVTLTTTPPAGECSWTGTWNTNFGPMRLTQDGNTVGGDYDHDQGQIQGTVSGPVLSGTWTEAPSRQPPSDAGNFAFTMNADCQIFLGSWRYGFEGEMASSWDGSRDETITPTPVTPTPTLTPTPTPTLTPTPVTPTVTAVITPTGECSWTGTWNTTFGIMRLTQSDGMVSGDYESDQGQIEGMVDGQVLSGTWTEGELRQPPTDAGNIVFTMAEDCQSFTGEWRYGFEGEMFADWGGERDTTDGLTPTPVTPTVGPGSTDTPGATPTGSGTGNTCNCEELAAAQATIAAQATVIAELRGPTPTPSPVTGPPASPETEEPQFTAHAEPAQLAVGEEVRVSGQSSGVGIPKFSVMVQDAGTELGIEVVRIDYEGHVERQPGGSRVLELVDASGGASGFEGTVEVTFRALAPGEAEVIVGASGEVATDFGYASGGASAAPLLITVVEASAELPTPGDEDVTQAPTSTDFITPDPAECSVTPRTADELAALAETPDQAAVDALEAAWLDPPLTVPDGAPADAATTAAVVETYRQMTACFNAGSELAVDALWTDDALRQIGARIPAGELMPVPADNWAAFQVQEVRLLLDGQIVAVWQQRGLLTTASFVHVLEPQDGRYLVDETLDMLIE